MSLPESINDANMFEIGDQLDKPVHEVEWTPDHENILVEWADKAMCYRWLHAKSNQHFSKMNTWFTIPVIIMSTVTGTANFAQDRFPENMKEYAPMIIGSVNLIAGIMTTIQQFLKVGELNESHRVSSITWDKFYRNIKVELAKHPMERVPVIQFMKNCKEGFDLLMETSPAIREQAISAFKTTFSGGKTKLGKDMTEAQRLFLDLKKPEVCDVLESTRNSVYKPKKGDIKSVGETAMIELIKKKNNIAKKEKIIDNFISTFSNEYSRQPTTNEIYENLQDEMKTTVIDTMLTLRKQKETHRENTLKNVKLKRNSIVTKSTRKLIGDDNV